MFACGVGRPIRRSVKNDLHCTRFVVDLLHNVLYVTTRTRDTSKFHAANAQKVVCNRSTAHTTTPQHIGMPECCTALATQRTFRTKCHFWLSKFRPKIPIFLQTSSSHRKVFNLQTHNYVCRQKCRTFLYCGRLVSLRS